LFRLYLVTLNLFQGPSRLKAWARSGNRRRHTDGEAAKSTSGQTAVWTQKQVQGDGKLLLAGLHAIQAGTNRSIPPM
jgi:hypothetical protein